MLCNCLIRTFSLYPRVLVGTPQALSNHAGQDLQWRYVEEKCLSLGILTYNSLSAVRCVLSHCVSETTHAAFCLSLSVLPVLQAATCYTILQHKVPDKLLKSMRPFQRMGAATAVVRGGRMLIGDGGWLSTYFNIYICIYIYIQIDRYNFLQYYCFILYMHSYLYFVRTHAYHRTSSRPPTASLSLLCISPCVSSFSTLFHFIP